MTPFNKKNNEKVEISQETCAEIRNALTVISGFAQILRGKPEMIDQDRKQLEEIIHQVERIDRLLPG